MKRSKRRNRWRLKAHLKRLDTIALARINASYSAATQTWGGTRCPGCGIGVRPHWVVPWSRRVGGGIMHGQTTACDRVRCPGECEWY